MGFLTLPQEATEKQVCYEYSVEQLNRGTRICIVLDNPTMEDFKSEKPMQGTYGSVLAQALSIARLTQMEVSILYVFPNVNSSFSYWNEKTGFSVTGCEYLKRLRVSIEKLNPNVVVPMGECAFQALTDKKGVSKWRGSMIGSSLVQRSCQATDASPTTLLQISGLTSGVKVVPTICPKTAVRMYLFRYYLINDLKRANDESLFPELRLPQRTLKTQPTYLDACAYLDWIIETRPEVSIDIEVNKGEVSCMSFSHCAEYGMSIAFDDAILTFDEELQVWLKIGYILDNPMIRKKLQNALFDRSFLMFKNRIMTRGYVNDTMIKQNLNYPDFPKGLGFLCSVNSREPYYKDDGKTWFADLKAGKGDINQFYEYNAKDSCVLHDIDPELTKDLKKFGNSDTYEFNRRLMEPLLYMMMRGIKVDNEKLAEHRVEADKARADLQNELDLLTTKTSGWSKPLNVASPQQCKDYFYKALGLAPHTIMAKDKHGNRVSRVSTSNKVMKKLAVKGVKEAKLVQQIRAYRKLIGTYLDVRYDKDGRLRCSYNIAGTRTGRLSSSETIFGTGTNMQNLPKVFKEFLVADPDCAMAELDKAQAEWVVVAYLCGDANMIATIERKEDAHINTAHLMFGAPKDLIKKEDKLLGSLTDEEKIREIRERDCPDILKYKPLSNMSCRQAGKKSNHGLNYDLGDNGFAQTYGLSLTEAKRCRSLYHRAYPAIKIWHTHIRNQLANDRTLTNLFGRKRRFLDRWGDNLFKAAYAYIPQSTVAQLLNMGLLVTYENQHDIGKRYLRDWDLLCQVHDSELFQYQIKNVYGFANTILYCQKVLDLPLVANGRTFVIRTDCKVGYDAKNLKELDLSGTYWDVITRLETLLKVQKHERDWKQKEREEKRNEKLIEQNEELFENEGSADDELTDKSQIASPEETVYAGIDYF